MAERLNDAQRAELSTLQFRIGINPKTENPRPKRFEAERSVLAFRTRPGGRIRVSAFFRISVAWTLADLRLLQFTDRAQMQ
jgi:hypothetical protein